LRLVNLSSSASSAVIITGLWAKENLTAEGAEERRGIVLVVFIGC